MLFGRVQHLSCYLKHIRLSSWFDPSNNFLASHDALHSKIEKQDKIFLFSIPYKKMVSHDNTSR